MYFPIQIQIGHKRCIVVGGGKVAERKILTLLPYECRLTVISPRLTPALEALWRAGKLQWQAKVYEPGDLKDSDLVFVATDLPEVSLRCREEATQAKLLLNVADRPELSDFILPAVHRQGPVTFTVSTEGASPLLAKKLKEEIGAAYGPAYEALALELGRLRHQALEEIQEESRRRELFQILVERGLKEGHQALQAVYEAYLNQGGTGHETD